MRYLVFGIKELKEIIAKCSYSELKIFTKYINDVAPGRILMSRLNSTKKSALVSYLVEILTKEQNIINITKKLMKTPPSQYLYNTIVWERKAFMATDKFFYEHFVTLPKLRQNTYGLQDIYLDGIFGLIMLSGYEEGLYHNTTSNVVTMSLSMASLLKVVLPIPDDFDMKGVKTPEQTKYTYSNEDNIFDFINIILDMAQSNLLEFSKGGEKPLVKTINILKSSTEVAEFFETKKLDTIATDMLIRSFYFCYMAEKKISDNELSCLKKFIKNKFDDLYYFFITRILLSHLKKVRFDSYYSRELGLFVMLKTIILQMPLNDWVSIEEVLKFSTYRELDFDLEYGAKTNDYYLESENYYYYCKENRDKIFKEPVIKGGFFYLAALGMVEIKYDDPKSTDIKALGKEYISTWDGLKYIKLTDLGKYLIGISKSYKQKEEVKKLKLKLKFDEYKPIITIDKTDTITQAKLEPYTEKQDATRYILSYAKIFKDCKNAKALEIKIANFYKQIEPNPPKVFKEFFNEIKENQNLLKKDTKMVIVELKDNKKLLNLFMKHNKLQELIIKAQGYKILILKDNLAKVTKILKDNGFFVEF